MAPRTKLTKSTPASTVILTKKTISKTSVTTSKPIITPYQKKVYLALLQIPSGRITTYAHLSNFLSSSPRAVGGALRRNPYAPQIPCHRVIASTGFIGGFMGDWRDAPSGINIEKKMGLLKGEGVDFSGEGMVMEKKRVWNGFVEDAEGNNGLEEEYVGIIRKGSTSHLLLASGGK